jgi:multisubunit Na+/H+ antiporter MnhE subunit
MAFGKTKILTSFAVFGFCIGAIVYMIVNWITTNNLLRFTPIPVMEILLAPWFISGTAGATLSILIVILVARYNR